MKTSLACLGILIVALIFGQRQGARIATWEQRISSARSVRPTKASREARQDQRNPAEEMIFPGITRFCPK